MRVIDILKNNGRALFTTTPSARLSDCVITMADNDAGSLLVIENGKLVGLLSFREVINILAKRQKEERQGPTPAVADLLVSQVMKPDPIVIDPDLKLVDLRGLMVQTRQRYMPVVNHGVVLGVVSFYDVAKAVHETQEFENRMLKSYIGDWPVLETEES
jgi:CBS domain-containing protein